MACAGVVAVVMIGLVMPWFPAPYFVASGGAAIATTIVMVDLVVGPLLTLIVYDRRKPSLRRDLCVIALLQVGALVYGLHAANLARPVFLVFTVDRFEIVSAAEVDRDELARAPEALRTLARGEPTLVGARRPDDPRERELLLFASASGIDLQHMMRYYVPYPLLAADAASRAKPIAALYEFNSRAEVGAALGGLAPLEGIGWVPVRGRKADLAALIDRRDGRLLKIVDLRPW